MSVRAGSKDTPVVFEQNVATPDSMGHRHTEVWQSVVEPFAKMYPVRGREVESEGQREPMARFRLIFDYCDVETVTPDMRMVIDGTRYFDIETILPHYGKRDETEMVVREVQHGY